MTLRRHRAILALLLTVAVITLTTRWALAGVPTDQLRADLKRFKQVMETGSVMRSDASVHKGPHAARPSARRIAEGK